MIVDCSKGKVLCYTCNTMDNKACDDKSELESKESVYKTECCGTDAACRVTVQDGN